MEGSMVVVEVGLEPVGIVKKEVNEKPTRILIL
jgi:hypothetical protein